MSSNVIETKKQEILHYNISGVQLNVKLDYVKGTVSFIEHNPDPNNLEESYQEFTFAEREHEFLGGWIKIFNTLEEVTRIADQKLKEQDEIRENRKTDTLIKIWGAIEEAKK